MRRGFIYSVRKAPFSYPKTDISNEFERLAKEGLGIDIELDDRQRFIFQMGYEFGLIDGGLG